MKDTMLTNTNLTLHVQLQPKTARHHVCFCFYFSVSNVLVDLFRSSCVSLYFLQIYSKNVGLCIDRVVFAVI